MKEPIPLEAMFPDRSSGEPLGTQLVRRLRAAIEGGIFEAGVRLLPSRELAKRLGLSRNTVTSALDQLVAEGYLAAQIGTGTFVTATFGRTRRKPPMANRPLPMRALGWPGVKHEMDAAGSSFGPLRLGVPDLSGFPRDTWQRIARRYIGRSDISLEYGHSAGLPALREAISQHVAQFRGVVAAPEQIVVVEGAQAGFHLAANVLSRPGDGLAIEDPCYALARAAFRAQGLELLAVPVDGEGLRTDALPERAALVYVTPCHQFPTGGALPLTRRLALLHWARDRGAYVIEDDYDSEFDAHPLPALQSLDREERVIYVGTFSKTLAPGLRLGYVVAPPHLAETFRLARALSSLGVNLALQATVAEFITRGHFLRHVRRMVATYERRRRILVGELAKSLPRELAIGAAQTGLHLTVTGPRSFDDVEAATVLEGQRFLPLSQLCVERTDLRGLVVGCSAGSDEAVAQAARELANALRPGLLHGDRRFTAARSAKE